MTQGPGSRAVRNRMAPEERRESILDAAQALFMEHGWDAVTIGDVLEAAEISKGGFYHHFSAKEDLLTGIVTRMTEQGVAEASVLSSRAEGHAVARLVAFLEESVRWKAENIADLRVFADVIMKPGNDMLFRRVSDATVAVVRPLLEELIAEGVAEGAFNVTDVQLTAEVIVGMSDGRRHAFGSAIEMATAGDIDRATGHLDRRMRAEGAMFDRLLGLETGSVCLSHPAYYSRILAGLSKSGAEPAKADISTDLKPGYDGDEHDRETGRIVIPG